MYYLILSYSWISISEILRSEVSLLAAYQVPGNDFLVYLPNSVVQVHVVRLLRCATALGVQRFPSFPVSKLCKNISGGGTH